MTRLCGRKRICMCSVGDGALGWESTSDVGEPFEKSKGFSKITLKHSIISHGAGTEASASSWENLLITQQVLLLLQSLLRLPPRLPHPAADVPSVTGLESRSPKPTSPRVLARGRGRIKFLGSAIAYCSLFVYVTAHRRITSLSEYFGLIPVLPVP
ncbi:hypothetical protein EJB05_44972, partial [Eragrostis curvula]